MELASTPSDARQRWLRRSAAALWSLVVYLAIVSPLDRLIPAINGWPAASVLLLGSALLAYFGLRSWVGHSSARVERLKDITLLCVVLLGSLLAMDVGYTAFTRLNPSFRVDQERFFAERLLDQNVWDGELMPIRYQPTDGNFYMYKPGQTKVATVFGEHYYTALLQHTMLRDAVFERRRIEFVIDRYGLRNMDEPARRGLFALGDSFCFGYHASQGELFTDRLKALLGEPVYNLGISSTSPMQQILLLEYLLQTRSDVFQPRHVFWLIFEGNDLAESYALQNSSRVTRPSLKEVFAGTVIGGLADVPALLRSQSVIRLVSDGQLALTGALARTTATNHFELDGEGLAYPVYHSRRFGPLILRQAYVEQFRQTEEEVLNHPNWPRLADAFRRMQSLASEHEFDVTVVLVPTKVRLYRDDIEDLPPSEEPHFIEQVMMLAAATGFHHVDLNTVLAPFAEWELLYYRDDTHWNPRGHAVVAEVLAEHLRGIDGGAAPGD